MNSSIRNSPHLSSLAKDREKEIQINRTSSRIVRSVLGRISRERWDLDEAEKIDYRQTGIYEAHLRGIPAEEIAFYGDYPVSYVERCIRYKELEDYSRRTGNAIIIQWPEE